MANEIYASLNASVNKGGAAAGISPNFRRTMAGSDFTNATQVIGNSPEVIDLGEIADTPSLVVIKNLDDTNFISIGGNSALDTFWIVVSPGEFCAFQPGTTPMYAVADTADVRIQMLVTKA